jgi:hypothetical protein
MRHYLCPYVVFEVLNLYVLAPKPTAVARLGHDGKHPQYLPRSGGEKHALDAKASKPSPVIGQLHTVCDVDLSHQNLLLGGACRRPAVLVFSFKRTE